MKKIECFGINMHIEPAVIKQIAVGEVKTIGNYGKVISVGADVKFIKPGDVIAFRKWGLIDVIIDDQVVFFIPETDKFIVSVLKDNE